MSNKEKEHYILMLERVIKNKDKYNIIELNNSTHEIISYFNNHYDLNIKLDYQNILLEKTIHILKKTRP